LSTEVGKVIVNDDAAVKPVAVADVPISDEDRKRIAQELGLSEDQYEAVPAKLSIARYNEDDIGGDVGGFLGQQLGGADVSQELAFTSTQFQTIGTSSLSITRISGALLIPV
jgi:hypothetical protein